MEISGATARAMKASLQSSSVILNFAGARYQPQQRQVQQRQPQQRPSYKPQQHPSAQRSASATQGSRSLAEAVAAALTGRRRNAPTLMPSKGYAANGKNYKVHLDGYDQSAFLRAVSGTVGNDQPVKSARSKFFCTDNDGLLVGLRQGDYKYVFAEQHMQGTLGVWAEPFVKLRLQKIFNLFMDPYERADITSNTFREWQLNHIPAVYGAIDEVGICDDLQGIPATIDPAELLRLYHHGGDAAGDQRRAEESSREKVTKKSANAAPGILHGCPALPAENEMSMKPNHSILAAAVALLTATAPSRAADPLPSWKDTASKKAIVVFVEKVTKEGGADFVPVAERIATFDNDGTLWAEQPIYFQFQFALDRVKALAPTHPEWKTKEPFNHLIAGDMKAFMAGGEKSLMAVMAAAHSGITTEEFGDIVKEWLATAKHPKTGMRYNEMVYQPMLEVLAYLRANGFKTFIVSGGGVEFMRTFAEKTYGIPPEQVIGSQGKLKFELRDGKPTLIKLPEVQFVDDGPGKAAGIQTFIGRRPIAAFGNSDGDLQMLQWTTAGPGTRFALIVHHTDAEREWAYDRTSHIGKLDKAWDEANSKGWTVVNMKDDWATIYPSKK
jgi:phosphoglycolate phosphatase-like HAD superfamily hydrolase